MSHPNAIDYSEVVRKWGIEKNIGEFKSQSIENVSHCIEIIFNLQHLIHFKLSSTLNPHFSINMYYILGILGLFRETCVVKLVSKPIWRHLGSHLPFV